MFGEDRASKPLDVRFPVRPAEVTHPLRQAARIRDAEPSLMRIGELMTEEVLVARPSERAADAWRRMRRGRVNHLVVMEGDRVVGVISTHDLNQAGASGRQAREVRELMTRSVVSAGPETPVRRAARLMRGRSIGCLPVLDNGRLVGIVTLEDLFDWINAQRDSTRLQGQWERTRPESRWSRQGRQEHQKSATRPVLN